MASLIIGHVVGPRGSDGQDADGSLVANALSQTASGRAFTVDDVSPLAHNLHWTVYGRSGLVGAPSADSPAVLLSIGTPVVGGAHAGQFAVTLLRGGENLFPTEGAETGRISDATGEETASDNCARTAPVWLQAGEYRVLFGSGLVGCGAAHAYTDAAATTGWSGAIPVLDGVFTLSEAGYVRLAVAPLDATTVDDLGGNTLSDHSPMLLALADTDSFTAYLDEPLRGVPVPADGNVAINGQAYIADTLDWEGTVTRRVGCVDLGTLPWILNSTLLQFTATLGNWATTVLATDAPPGILCTCYPVVSRNITSGSFITSYGKQLRVNDPDCHGVTAFTAAVSGCYVVYPYVEPVSETVTPPDVPARSPRTSLACDGMMRVGYNQDANAALCALSARIAALEAET